MAVLLSIVGGLAWLVGLICFIMVVVKMFQAGRVGLGVTCIVLSCCGIGYIIAFVVGWVKAREWNLNTIMAVWTVCWVLHVADLGVNYPEYRRRYEEQMQQIQQQRR
jgi:hypothetical protein